MTHPNRETLRLLYQDFGRFEQYATDDVRLHRFDRAPGSPPVQGKQNVLAYQQAFQDATRGTRFMDVESITANSFFGVVLGVLRASGPGAAAMPFCGLWRFTDGLITEHWENAYVPAELTESLGQDHPF